MKKNYILTMVLGLAFTFPLFGSNFKQSKKAPKRCFNQEITFECEHGKDGEPGLDDEQNGQPGTDGQKGTNGQNGGHGGNGGNSINGNGGNGGNGGDAD